MLDFLNVNQYIWIALFIAVLAALAVGLAVWLIASAFRGRLDDAAYREQLKDLASGMSEEEELLKIDHGRNVIERWQIHWQKLGKASGIPLYSDKDNGAYIHVAVLGVATFLGINLFLKNPISGPIVGLIGAAMVVYGINVLFKMKYNQEAGKINDQLPGFLFAMKANLQANETPVRAMLKIVDNMPQPLRDDLTIVKQKLLANSSFSESLEAMVLKTSSSELKFLGSCLIQAADSGANIEPQLDIIQNVLEQRKAAAAELRKAVKATLPSIYVGTFAIPISLIAAYVLDANAKDFWFKSFFSWIALGVVIALWALGMVLTRKMVESIKNL